ncbi:MAG TPA: SDR family oxidoreductase [Chloroflexota bacterium]|nr:SDR family oxidoreductase [Chloroflexota bacterium]
MVAEGGNAREDRALMEGRVCVVTGATSGIGREAVLKLAGMGARIVAAARDEGRAAALVRDVTERTGREIETVLADLSSMGAVRRLADDVLARHDAVHVLVNNAGILGGQRQVTADGVERTIAVNHLAPFLLTHLLRDAVRRGAAPGRASRVVTVASDAHRASRLGTNDLDDLTYAKRYSAMRAYCDSKLANVLFAYELARREAEHNVASYAVHPGSVRSGWGRDGHGMMGLLLRLIGPFQLSSERGARPVVRAATDAALERQTGIYVTQKGVVSSSPRSYDEALAKRLWEVSERLTGVA